MKRIVQPEILDTLPPDDPRAVARDGICAGERLMCTMHHGRRWKKTGLVPHPDESPSLARATELSPPYRAKNLAALAGNNRDAARLAKQCFRRNARRLRRAGLARKSDSRRRVRLAAKFSRGRVVIANLFLHHFEDARLAELLRLISQRATLFVAIEPHRFRYPSACAQLLGLSLQRRHAP